MNLTPYIELIRANKPQGTLLLWAPTAQALWIAAHGTPSFEMIFVFLIGTFLMRSAGCIVNDLADRNFDGKVFRTKERPLAKGTISLVGAFSLLFIFLTLSASLLFFMPFHCIYWAFLALALTIIYPFTKRILSCPQAVLGFAFMMGIPMATRALNEPLTIMTFLLCAITFFWVLAYDTQYALADKKDDEKIGIRSSAIWFGDSVYAIIAILQIISHLLWLPLAYVFSFSIFFYVIWFIAGIWFLIAAKLIRTGETKNISRAFSLNAFYGLTLWFAVMLGVS